MSFAAGDVRGQGQPHGSWQGYPDRSAHIDTPFFARVGVCSEAHAHASRPYGCNSDEQLRVVLQRNAVDLLVLMEI